MIAQGSILQHRYEILRPLGQGAAASTLLAKDLLRQDLVALKLLRSNDPPLTSALRTEFAFLSGRHHPHLSQVRDLAVCRLGNQQRLFYTADFIQGLNLRDWAKGRSEREVLPPLADVLDALHFLHRLNQELDLPVYIFTDGDPWGMHIAMVIISGSANAAHLRGLTTPDAKWGGVYATDIVDYKLPTDPLTDVDIKRLHELEKDPRYTGDLWKREIKTFLKIKKKAEQEAFSRYGLTYIVDEYLPAKLEAMAD